MENFISARDETGDMSRVARMRVFIFIAASMRVRYGEIY